MLLQPNNTPYTSLFAAMTTNLSAIAGPSRQAAELQPKVEPASPIEVVDNEVSVTKPGISVSESGEVVKVPAFLNKLYR